MESTKKLLPGKKALPGSEYAEEVLQVLILAHPKPLSIQEIAKQVGISTKWARLAIECLTPFYPIYEEEGIRGTLYGVLK